jgi:hypothetical protein
VGQVGAGNPSAPSCIGSESYVILTEARGGRDLWNEILRRGLSRRWDIGVESQRRLGGGSAAERKRAGRRTHDPT